MDIPPIGKAGNGLEQQRPRSRAVTPSHPRITQIGVGPSGGDTTATSRDEVKLYVGYLRRKLDPEAPRGTPIETVRGFGYRYKTPD